MAFLEVIEGLLRGKCSGHGLNSHVESQSIGNWKLHLRLQQCHHVSFLILHLLLISSFLIPSFQRMYFSFYSALFSPVRANPYHQVSSDGSEHESTASYSQKEVLAVLKIYRQIRLIAIGCVLTTFLLLLLLIRHMSRPVPSSRSFLQSPTADDLLLAPECMCTHYCSSIVQFCLTDAFSCLGDQGLRRW